MQPKLIVVLCGNMLYGLPQPRIFTCRILIPGQAYWLLISGIGSNGVGLWTDPLHMMVV
ncbi:MAG: hypothetical protein WCL60_02285 [Methylococcales bacterium]